MSNLCHIFVIGNQLITVFSVVLVIRNHSNDCFLKVIGNHYNDQLRLLIEKYPNDEALRGILRKCRDDELEHQETAVQHNAKKAPLYNIVHPTIKAITSTAVWVATRI